METRFFGIRHHGPGSAKRLVDALLAFEPDVLVIEAPADTDDSWKYLRIDGFKPPVALLVYNVDNLEQASYYPFAAFSPEWNAVHYALQHHIPVIGMDLPQSLRWAYQNKSQNQQESLFLPVAAHENLPSEIERDPLGFLARLAGYTDIERWWDATLEHKGNSSYEVFDTILELMQEMRTVAAPPQGEEALREAYMRQTLRDVQKKDYQRIAVVCGAWHTPVLANIKQYKAADDKQLLKGIGKVKTQFTWIPWTYQRLATLSGYGAGVISPAWYEFIFVTEQNAVASWMAKAAELLRQKDLETSTASVIEAVRLAETLAVLRLRHLPGIDELWEAAVSVFGQGNEEALHLVYRQWIVGDRIGDVPDKVPNVPLHADIEALAKSLRIPKPADKLWFKSTGKPGDRGGLDLRKAFDRQQSHFLHRLNVLGIGWGEPQQATGRELTSMNEYWQLQWKPELVLNIIEVGMWGNTLEEAASKYVFHKSHTVNDLSELALLFQKCLKANLPLAIEALAQQLQKVAALTTDIAQLIAALSPLAYSLRYGDVRQTDKTLIQTLVNELVPRICIGFVNACAGLDEENSRLWKKHLESMHQTLALLQIPHFYELWYRMLGLLSEQQAVQALLRGSAVRLLMDAQQLSINQTANKMYLALSPSQEIAEAAAWMEGFLSGSGLLLLHHPALWSMLDGWVTALPNEAFQTVLPVLRRTFAHFSAPERQKMLQMVKNKDSQTQKSNTVLLNQSLIQTWLPMYQRLVAKD